MQNIQVSVKNLQQKAKVNSSPDEDQFHESYTDCSHSQTEKNSQCESTGDNSEQSRFTRESYSQPPFTIRKLSNNQQNETRQNGIVSGILSMLCGCCQTTTNNRMITEQALLMNSNLTALQKVEGKSPPYLIGQKISKMSSPMPSQCIVEGIVIGGSASSSQVNSNNKNNDIASKSFISNSNNQQDKKSDVNQLKYTVETNILQRALEGLEDSLTLRNQRADLQSLDTVQTLNEWQTKIQQQILICQKQQIKSFENSNKTNTQQYESTHDVTSYEDIDSLYVTKKYKKNVNEWTTAEDDKLLKAYSQFKSNWQRVSQILSNGKDAQQCRKRYQYLNSKNLTTLLQPVIKTKNTGKVVQKEPNNKGQWDSETDCKIIELVKKFGFNWKQIAKYVPNKNPRQIGDRFHNVLKSKLSEPKEFSQIEDQLLINTFEQHPNDWKEILKSFPGRNAAMIKERFYILREQLNSSLLAPPFKNDKNWQTTWSDEFDGSQSTVIRTSTDVETKDGTTVTNDGQMYGSWDHLDENTSNANFINETLNNNTNSSNQTDFGNNLKIERKDSKNQKNVTPTMQTTNFRFSPVITCRFNPDDTGAISQGNISPFDEPSKPSYKYKFNIKPAPSQSLGCDMLKLFQNNNAGDQDTLMLKHNSSGFPGLSDSHSYVEYMTLSANQSKVWRRESLFSHGQQSSKHSMASLMNKDIQSSQVSNSDFFLQNRVRVNTTNQDEDIKSISTHLERLSLDVKSNISMTNECIYSN